MTTADTAASGATRILIEKRFPLSLSRSILSIRELYEQGKRQCWNPAGDVPWADLDPARHDKATRDAARLTWSRRLWVEYTGLSETPALLIRFCLEPGREADPKYFLTVRNTEEAWHIECFDRLAEAFGGRVEQPADPVYAAAFNRTQAREALDAGTPLDGYVAVHCALEGGIDLALYQGYLENAADPVVKRVLEMVVAAKTRHAAFGWLYLEERAPSWDSALKADIGAALVRHIETVEQAGYHCPWANPAAAKEAEADRIVAAAGLGACAAEREREIVNGYLDRSWERFAELGVAAPTRPSL
ncbi:MAG: hypothetical protein NXI21_00350 [Alphaproteobacteria bacterium]|nr:hypothetical protein [Alphaproteobacteria bacterium]